MVMQVTDDQRIRPFILRGFLENPRCSVSLFTANVLCLLAVPVLTLASTPGAAGSDIDIAELKARAEYGDAQAQANLGFKYANVDRVPKNLTEAVKWYRKAAQDRTKERQPHWACSSSK